MIFKDYYKILGLESNKTSLNEIKTAFRDQAKKYHPDVNSGKFSEERFKDINEAYKVLSDSTAKRKYDRIWYSHVGKRLDREKDKLEREQKTDFLGVLFGNQNPDEIDVKAKKKIPVKGENIETEIEVSLEEAYYGLEKKISLRTVNGKMKTFSIAIPAGIRNGEKIRLIGEGKQGQNGAKNGDLFIKININNTKKYKLKGYDIYTDLFLAPWEAALGTRTQVETIDSSANIFVPRGIETGEIIRIPGKGYKDGKGGRGDLVAEIKIIVPKELSQEEINMYEKLKEISNFEPRK